MPDQPWTTSWGPLRSELEADVRRVSDRLRSLSATRLAAAPAPRDGEQPDHTSRAGAGRAAAVEMVIAAFALEAAAGSPPSQVVEVPTLSDFAVGDQVAVTGQDLVAAMDLVGPDTMVATVTGTAPARDVVRHAAAVLADVRRRL